MSDRDSFIDEVSEEIRRDRYFALWKRYGPVLIAALAAIVVVAAALAWLDRRDRAEAEAAGGALLRASDGDFAAQAAAMRDLAETTDHDGETLLALLRAAGAMAAAGDPDGAAALYDRVAADGAADRLLQDFAAFRAISLRGAR